MPAPKPSFDGVEKAADLGGNVLIIGFGRFGQVASQGLLARGYDVSIIETDVDMIRAAADFGFLVHYGDGTRLDILQTSGAGRADAVLVCVDKRETADRIVALVKSEFPLTKLFVRAYDRGHTIDLIHAGVDYQIRETFESAMLMGEAALVGLGVPEDEAAEITADVRRRDDGAFGPPGGGRHLCRRRPYARKRPEARTADETAPSRAGRGGSAGAPHRLTLRRFRARCLCDRNAATMPAWRAPLPSPRNRGRLSNECPQIEF